MFDRFREADPRDVRADAELQNTYERMQQARERERERERQRSVEEERERERERAMREGLERLNRGFGGGFRG